jgi:glucokinase
LGFAPIAIEGGRVARLDDLAAGEAGARRLGSDGARLYDLSTKGDPEALAAVREAGEALGLGIATLVNLLNPEFLFLGGGAFELPGYREAALEIAERYALPDRWRVCTMRPTRAGAEVAALGRLGEATAAGAALEAGVPMAEADRALSGVAAKGHLRVRARDGGLFYSFWRRDAPE